MIIDDTYSRLRAAILHGAYAPKQRLIETELAEELSASRFIVRNALLQLAAEGLVEIQPNRGARVREISIEEAIEITEVRRSLEALVASQAALHASEAERVEIRALGEAMAQAVHDTRLVAYSELNAELHARIRDAAGHGTASRIIGLLNSQMVRHQFMLALVPGRPAVSLKEHLEIISAIADGDADRATAAMQRHLDSVLEALHAFRTSTETSSPVF